MMLKQEKRIGETRYGLYAGKRVVELHVERWSAAGQPRAGDISRAASPRLIKPYPQLSLIWAQDRRGF
jgi:hypothetical protein